MQIRNYFILAKEIANFCFSIHFSYLSVTKPGKARFTDHGDKKNTRYSSLLLCNGCTNYNYYHHYNPLRVVKFHITTWAYSSYHSKRQTHPLPVLIKNL
jgi:hypothetical protein